MYLCVSFYGAAQHNAAVAAGERALALSVATGDSQLQVLAHSHLGQALVARTDYERGIEYLWKVVASQKASCVSSAWARGLCQRCLPASTWSADWSSSAALPNIACGEEAIQIAELGNHPSQPPAGVLSRRSPLSPPGECRESHPIAATRGGDLS